MSTASNKNQVGWNVTAKGEIARRSGVERWYVARTLPHGEVSAKQHLVAQGFHTFLPLQEKTIRHARRTTTVSRPVFPRYLFVHMDLTAMRWRSVNGTIGIDRLLMHGGMPEPVRPGVVETLIASSDDDDRLQFHQSLKQGDRVRLLDGPFADQLGVLQILGPNERVQVLLTFLGGPVSVHLTRSSLAPAG